MKKADSLNGKKIANKREKKSGLKKTRATKMWDRKRASNPIVN